MLGEKYFRPLRKAPWTFCAQGRNRAKGSVSALFRDRAHGSAAANPAGQHGARGDCFSRLAREVPAPRHEVSRRREMRFHCVIILTMPRLRVRQGKPGHNEISPRNNLACLKAVSRLNAVAARGVMRSAIAALPRFVSAASGAARIRAKRGRRTPPKKTG